MPINRDLSSLAAAEPRSAVVPDLNPFIGRALAGQWLDENHEQHKNHAVEGTKFRFSMAGSCSRALAYYMTQVEETDPIDEADAWRMGLGTMIHEALQDACVKAFPGAETEVKVQVDGLNGSGHIDMVLHDVRDGKPWVTAVEIKSINGFGFKMAATGFKGPAEGPRRSHIQQGALGAMSVNADELIICYVAMENVSPSLAKYSDDPVFGRFTAQWTYDRATYMKYAVDEIDRVNHVINALESGASAIDIEPTVENNNGVIVSITNPSNGAWILQHENEVLDSGTVWNCNYCRWQSRCSKE